MEATGDLVHNIISPTDLRELKTLARQLSSSYQQSIPMVIAKIESKLGFFAYTLGELDLDAIEDDDSGSETFFVIGTGTKEVCKNAYIELSWNKMSSGVASPASDLRPDGSSLQYTVKVIVKEVSPEELSSMYGSAIESTGENFFNQDENDEAEEDNETGGDDEAENEDDDYEEGENKFKGVKNASFKKTNEGHLVAEGTIEATKHYDDHHKAIGKMLDRMVKFHKQSSSKSMNSPKDHADWGHTGTLAHHRAKLQDIHDSMFHEGEYK